MREQLEQYVKQVKEWHEDCLGNEQATKASLIAPLFDILGYNMHDPRECKPEYRMDFGRGEKAATPVDWAFLKDGAFAFFVEAKEAGAKITKYPEQLGMYFSKQPGVKGVKLGILTNGTQWQFFTDLRNDNAMDTEPFFTWDVLKHDPALAVELMTILQKSKFTPQLVRTFAERKHHQTLLVGVLNRLLEPSPEFVKLAIGTSVNDSGDTLVSGKITEKVIEQWKPILADAIHEWAKQQTLSIALQHPNAAAELEPTHDEDEPPDELTDRGYWESRGTKETLQATDELLKLVNSIEPRATLKYNKYYIGLEIDGSPRNFVVFRPQKKCVLMGLRLPQDKETDEQVAKAGFDILAYDSQFKEYRLKLDPTIQDKQRDVLLRLVRKAWEGFGRHNSPE